MLKASKLSHKSHKSSKSSGMRKSHISRKSLHSKSPSGLSRSSRSTSMKHLSPGMKRGHGMPKRKDSHSPRLRSIASSPHRSLSRRTKQESPVPMDRTRSIKGIKYEKRKHLSASPVRHVGSSTSRRPGLPLEAHNMPPYETERYQSSSAAIHPSEYSPSRKKLRRVGEPYYTRESVSPPPPRHPAAPVHSESHASHRAENISVLRDRHHISSGHGERDKHVYDERSKHMSSSAVPRTHSKETSLKAPYPGEGSSRYRSASPNERYPSGQKSFAPTLHERFSTVIESSRAEPRVRYSREDLEKITIDIKRNVREPSPTLRRIMNPSDIKLVRRANEGHRPIFDREEIKQAPRDLREDAYYERKASGSGYNSMHSIDLREVENYQITRHRFDNHHDLFSSSSGRTLNDRWQNPDGRKDTATLDRDEREKGYDRAPVSRNYVEARSRSRSGDRDFRSERYIDAKPTHRSDYPSRPHIESVQSRNNIPYSKNSVPLDARHKLSVRKGDRESHSSVRSETKGQFHPHADHHYSDNIPPPPRMERRDHHSPESHKWNYKTRSLSREKVPEFPRRPDKYNYKSWDDKPDIPPKSSDYFEHGGREGSSSYSTRGGSRPFRTPRGFRGRGFRPPIRGTSYYRGGSFRGGFRTSTSPRGRGISRR